MDYDDFKKLIKIKKDYINSKSKPTIYVIYDKDIKFMLNLIDKLDDKLEKIHEILDFECY